MTVQLAALEIPLRATGREQVLKDFADIDRAGEKAGAAVNIPVKTAGAVEAVRSLASVESITGRLTDKLRAMGVAEKDIPKALERAAPAVQQLAASTQALAGSQQAVASATNTATTASRQQVQAVDTATAATVRATDANQRLVAGMTAAGRQAHAAGAGARAWAAGMAALQVQQAATSGAVVTGSTQAVSGLKRMTAGLSQLAVMALGTQSAVAGLATGGLLTLGATAGVTLAVVAGAAAIAFAWEKLTESSRKTKEAVKQMREELEKLSPTEAAFKNLQVAADGLAAAEKALAKAKAPTVVETGEKAVTFAPDPKAIKKAEAEVARFRKNVEAARTAVAGIAREGFDQDTATLVKAIELRTASARQIQVATERIRILDAAAKDETKTLAEQNAAQAQANELRAAFTKIADEEADAVKRANDERQRSLDKLRDEAALLVDIGQERALTAHEVERLRGVYDRLTHSIDTLNLTDKQRLELLRSQRSALRELAESTSVTFAKPLSFGQPPLTPTATASLGLARPPALTLPSSLASFGPDADQTAAFFGKGFTSQSDELAQVFEKQMADSRARLQGIIDDSFAEDAFNFDQLTSSLAQGLTESIAGGIAQGFEQGIAAGSLGEGAKALTAALLSGLGSAAINFGVGSLAIAKLMVVIKKALASLNPVAAIPAAIGLIALGGALKGVASRMFNSLSGGESGSGSAASTPTGTRITVGSGGEITKREPLNAASTITLAAPRTVQPSTIAVAPTAAQLASQVEPARVVVPQTFHVYGSKSPEAQRWISDASNEGARRGLTFANPRRG